MSSFPAIVNDVQLSKYPMIHFKWQEKKLFVIVNWQKIETQQSLAAHSDHKRSSAILHCSDPQRSSMILSDPQRSYANQTSGTMFKLPKCISTADERIFDRLFPSHQGANLTAIYFENDMEKMKCWNQASPFSFNSWSIYFTLHALLRFHSVFTNELFQPLPIFLHSLHSFLLELDHYVYQSY